MNKGVPLSTQSKENLFEAKNVLATQQILESQTTYGKKARSPLVFLSIIVVALTVSGCSLNRYFRSPESVQQTEVVPSPTTTSDTTIKNSVATNTPTSIDEMTTSTSSSGDVLNWQTYTNDKFGFQLKYPHTWHSNDCNRHEIFLLHPTEVPICIEPVFPIQLFVKDMVSIEEYIENWEQAGYNSTLQKASSEHPTNVAPYLLEKIEPGPGPEKLFSMVIPLKNGLLEIQINDLQFMEIASKMTSTFELLD